MSEHAPGYQKWANGTFFCPFHEFFVLQLMNPCILLQPSSFSDREVSFSLGWAEGRQFSEQLDEHS